MKRNFKSKIRINRYLRANNGDGMRFALLGWDFMIDTSDQRYYKKVTATDIPTARFPAGDYMSSDTIVFHNKTAKKNDASYLALISNAS